MIIVISPAKKLDYESSLPSVACTEPGFMKEANQLACAMRKLEAESISQLMNISPALGQLNYRRFQHWKTKAGPAEARPAVFAFRGDVYVGLDADTLSEDDLAFAQRHLRVLSGLYGVLRPLDRIQAHRLEMGTRFAIGKAENLYQFWGDSITECLNNDLQGADNTPAALINLASQEYFSSVRPDSIDAPIITPVFKEYRKGALRVISFNAKRARGMMARFIIRHRLTDPEALKTFSDGDYCYDPDLSGANEWLFRRG